VASGGAAMRGWRFSARDGIGVVRVSFSYGDERGEATLSPAGWAKLRESVLYAGATVEEEATLVCSKPAYTVKITGLR
jgi:hypothetical protein